MAAFVAIGRAAGGLRVKVSRFLGAKLIMLWCSMETPNPHDAPSHEVFRELHRLREENEFLRKKCLEHSHVLSLLAYDSAKLSSHGRTLSSVPPQPPAV